MFSFFDLFVIIKCSGKGLGLVLVFKIVCDYGGVVECENYLKGVFFCIFLFLGMF